MITATHDGLTVASTTGTEADAQAAIGVPPVVEPDTPVEAPAHADTSSSDAAPPAASDSEVVTPEAPAEPEAPPPDEKKTSYQSRIDRLRWEAAEAERQRQQLDARVRELEAALAAQKAAPADKPTIDQYDSYEAWIEATAQWHARQVARETVAPLQQRVEAERAERTRVDAQSAFRDRIEAARSEFADYDATISQDIPISQPLKDYIETAPDGPRLAYALGKYPDEAREIAEIDPRHPVAFGRAIGSLLARLGTASSGPVPVAASVSTAPRPIKPVGSVSAAATVPLDQMDFAQFEKLRNQQELEWRRSRR